MICEICLSNRNELIEKYYRSGMILDEIGVKFGITRERVRQILKTRNVPARCGGVTLRTILKSREKQEHRRSMWNKRAEHIYGCGFEKAQELNNGLVFSAKGSRARLYVEQRRNSRTRGIAWRITFPEWCAVWDESRKWDERGKGKYVMARIGDSGPYQIGNVEIITQSQNSKDGYLVSPWSERHKKALENGISERKNTKWRLAYELHKSGKTLSEITVLLGVKRATAWQYVYNAKRREALAEQSA